LKTLRRAGDKGGWLLAAAVLIHGCSVAPQKSDTGSVSAPTTPPTEAPKPGGYYKDDGPGDRPLAELLAIPDAQPRWEPLHKYANKKYAALGREYVPDTEYKPYRAVGLASWYGRRFHGKNTSSGEPYDMYAMTAAHPTLPIPSYVRVTNLDNGKSVILRVNDRGPFHKDRLVDLSYTAAHKLDMVRHGSGRVMVESINPDEYQAEQAELAKAAQAAEPPRAGAASAVYLQMGAFGKHENALALVQRARAALPEEKARVVREDGLYRVHLGPYRDAEEAEQYRFLVQEYLGILPHKVAR
jgi:rare lipoprotein A